MSDSSYTETYLVRFWDKNKETGYWSQLDKYYMGKDKSFHSEIEKLWRKDYPFGKLVYIDYV